MAQQTTVQLIDDVDGTSEATETISFQWDGQVYEIDVNDEHARELRAGLDLFVQHARRVGRRKVGHQDNFKRTTLRPDSRIVRAWATDQGIEVSASGRIPGTVYEQYEVAHQG